MTLSGVNSSETQRAREPDDPFGFELDDQQWLAQLRSATRSLSGMRIGEFELSGELRRGAQGVVVRARDPRTGRTIALKRLVHGAWSTSEQRRRFEREVESAAALNHPNIVAVHGFELVDGQPVLKMEWVEGEPIDRWARRSANGGPLPRDAVLAVFLRVCDAVHHAHLRGVIHRDLKPGNILIVDGATPEPKLLDFGMAKRVEPTSSAARLTTTGDFVGSPAYAAPEQLSGHADAVDIRTDVYALGVVLYELLTGRLPFSTDQGVAALFDAIRNADVTPPSRISRGADRELDAIILKALAREPQRRYQSVHALAADLHRYQAGEAIDARRGQRSYAVRKFLSRHWIGVSIAAVFIVALAAGAVALGLMYAEQGRLLAGLESAWTAESKARKDAERVQAVLEQLLVQVAEAGRGSDLALRRALLADAERTVAVDLGDASGPRARAYDAIGRTYAQLALYEDAERCLRAALDLQLSVAGPGSLEEAASRTHLSDLLQDRSRYAEAERGFRRALEIRLAVHGDEHVEVAESFHDLGHVLSNRGQFAEALEAYRRSLDMRRQLLGERDPETITSLTSVGLAYANLDDLDAAERYLTEALEMSIDVLGPEHRDTAGRQIAVGKILQARGRLDEAEQHLREGLALYRSLLGDQHDNVAWAAHRLGVLLHARGKLDEAEPLLREALATYQAILGPDDPFVGFVCESLAALLRDAGRADEAAALKEEAGRIRTSTHTLPN